GMRNLRGVKNVFESLFLLLFLFGQGAIYTVFAEGFTNRTDKQILDNLLDHVNYDYRVRPSDLTCINVSVVLLSLSSPDESSLEYEVEFLMHQVWYDPRLNYDNMGRYQYLNALKHLQNIWMPDTYFIKHGKLKEPLIPADIALQVYPDGRVYYTQRREITMNCQGNLGIFPFDNPKCSFAFESVSHEDSEVKLEWNTLTPDLRDASSLRTHNAYLVKNETGICDQRHTWRGNYSCLTVLLVFTRDKSYYYTVVFVPGTLLVTSSFLSFWLDINAVPARVMIGVTTMLNFCTTTNSFRSTLPVVSDLNAMNLWDGVCMFFIYISVLEFIAVNFLYRFKNEEEIPSSPISSTNQRSCETFSLPVYSEPFNVITTDLPYMTAFSLPVYSEPFNVITKDLPYMTAFSLPVYSEPFNVITTDLPYMTAYSLPIRSEIDVKCDHNRLIYMTECSLPVLSEPLSVITIGLLRVLSEPFNKITRSLHPVFSEPFNKITRSLHPVLSEPFNKITRSLHPVRSEPFIVITIG
ncbi:glutamate-gated chloride channel subunit beta-like, partial [Limulus polyphemus]|uniref:Glutamate-gated chloride channel subunit beta-like n=1 Tax=Limulus polyphemus TaxID=6850 RepID=A0ABM1BI37_LIMPO